MTFLAVPVGMRKGLTRSSVSGFVLLFFSSSGSVLWWKKSEPWRLTRSEVKGFVEESGADVPPQGLFTCSVCPLSRSLPLRRCYDRVSRRVQTHMEDQVSARAGALRLRDRMDHVPL